MANYAPVVLTAVIPAAKHTEQPTTHDRSNDIIMESTGSMTPENHPLQITLTDDSYSDDELQYVTGDIASTGKSVSDLSAHGWTNFLDQIKHEITNKVFITILVLSILATFSTMLFLPLGMRFFQFNLSMITLLICFAMLAVFGISPYSYSEGFFLPVSLYNLLL